MILSFATKRTPKRQVCVKRPPGSKGLPADFQNPFHLTVSDSQPSEGPNACLVQLLEIYFLQRSRSGARFLAFQRRNCWLVRVPLHFHTLSGPSRIYPLPWKLLEITAHLHVYIPSCGEDASTPNLSYLIRVKILFATRCGRSASTVFPASAYRMRASDEFTRNTAQDSKNG